MAIDSEAKPSVADCGDIACSTTTPVSSFKSLSFLDRFLAIWIFLSMAIGIILGYFVPELSNALQKGEFVGVSVAICVGLLVMMYPILCKVQYETLPLILKARSLWIHFAFSIVLNWIVAPLFMVGLAWAFLPDEPELREGLILVGVARCIAMVLIWTNLASADLPYCAMLVALNSLLQIALFAPFSILYINIISKPSTDVSISYSTVATSVAVFLGIPLAAAIITRLSLFRLLGETGYAVFIKWISPFSLLGLLFTIIVLFACQSARIVSQIVAVCRVAAPLIIYFLVIFTFTMAICRYMGRWGNAVHVESAVAESDEVTAKRARRKVEWGYGRSTTQALTAASNNFELAIAVAVAAYGVGSKQALAATVGPLIEVPVLLGLVEVAKWLRKRWNWE
ncbi:sodium bile acid symporter family-domain-containing protein [Terfezia claveryi]|nr:sodium bile acid symporter family-domain-containing protein [Terfezia claveryi]